jgi:hypothetical protein
MATVTLNFNWPVPTSTDLVKDGATAIEALGDSIDGSLVDLKGGTTGQVLAKASGTDMDFAWVAQDDSNAIQNSIVDAKGDLIAATANDTPARLAVGANDTVLTADSTTATGLKWAAPGGGGGMTLLNTGGTTLTGTSVSITSIPSTYNDLRIYVVNFKPTNNGNGFAIRFNQDANANRHANTTTFSPGSIAFNATQAFVAADQNNSVATGLISLTIPYYANATTWKIVQGASVVTDPTTSTNAGFFNWAGLYNQTTAISSLEFRSQSDFLSGTVYVYGVK